MFWRNTLASLPRMSKILLSCCTFAIADIIALNVMDQIKYSSIGWSYTGFSHSGFRWGYDAIWFPTILLLTSLAFYLPAQALKIAPRKSLIYSMMLFIFLRLLAAYSLWFNLGVIKPLILKFNLESKYYPPWEAMGNGSIVFFEVVLLVLCIWIFSIRPRSLKNNV